MRILCGAIVASALSAHAAAQAVGYTEDFASSAAGWDGGGATVTWIPSGGVGGASDGFIEVSTEFSSSLGARAGGAAESFNFLGDYLAAGVTGVSFFLNELDTDEGTSIHVVVGTAFSNVWQYIVAHDPSAGVWTEFTVDFTDTANWTRIRGNGTFEQALANTDRLLFRHDLAPFTNFPDPIAATIGIDRVTLIPAPASAALLLAAAGASVRRRRTLPV